MVGKLVKIVFSIWIFVLAGCSSIGGTYKSNNEYSNVKLIDEAIAFNVINMINLPPVYSNPISNSIKRTLNENNKFIPMQLPLATDPKFKYYVLANIPSNEKIKITSDARVNKYVWDRTIEMKTADGFMLMLNDGEYLEKYPYSVLIKLRNTTQEKNFAASLLSAITVMAIPIVREHTITIDADFYFKTEKIGQYSEKVEYDYSYSWGVNEQSNLHTMYVESLLIGMLNEFKKSIAFNSSSM